MKMWRLSGSVVRFDSEVTDVSAAWGGFFSVVFWTTQIKNQLVFYVKITGLLKQTQQTSSQTDGFTHGTT
jgi:hypothetical protein